MELKQAERLASLTSADENQNNLKPSDTQVSKAIEDTPLRIVKNEHGWFVAFQQNRITEIFEEENTLINFMQFGDIRVFENDDKERIIGFHHRQAWKTICVLMGVIGELVLQNALNTGKKEFDNTAQPELFNNQNQ